MCHGRCVEENALGECALSQFDPNKCPLEILSDQDIGDYDIPLELREVCGLGSI